MKGSGEGKGMEGKKRISQENWRLHGLYYDRARERPGVGKPAGLVEMEKPEISLPEE